MANQKIVWYKYKRDDQKRRVSIEIHLGDLALDRLAIRVPKGYGAVQSVRVNGRKLQHFKVTALGNDAFVSISHPSVASARHVVIHFLAEDRVKVNIDSNSFSATGSSNIFNLGASLSGLNRSPRSATGNPSMR